MLQGRAPIADVRIVTVDAEGARRTKDKLAVEEPLEIRCGGPGQPATRVAVTMRTPGHDFELAAGFLFTEGLLDDPQDVESIRYCDDIDTPEQQYNVVTVNLRRPFDASVLQRNFYATSSCGICGKAAIDHIEVSCDAIVGDLTVSSETVLGLSAGLRARQRVFDRTGGLHATGLFASDGSMLETREDVGRHNAMDKLIGARFLAGETPLSDRIALVSGRASFELVQKIARAGVPVLCAVSAPSSLAVETARRLGVTLVGFLRDERFNVYCGAERIEGVADRAHGA